MVQSEAEVPSVSAGGLVTVAFLKARLDEGSDHLGIFTPLVLDVVAQLPGSNFAAADVQEALAKTHGVAMPQETVATLLKRATRNHYVVREAGRYRRNPARDLPPSKVASEKAQVEVGLVQLGKALQSHAARRELALASPDAALDILFQFLEKEQVAILLGGLPGLDDGTGVGQRERIIIAEFVHDVISGDPALISVLRGVLEGLVLYHAAFLPELSNINRNFKDLRVAFDSVLVRQALGYEGVAMRTLMRETLDLLKASGVQCLVFDKTVHEIQRILAMYETKLATAAGRSSLRPVPMVRHFVTERYSPSDVRQMSVLLESEVAAAGFQIQQAPRRVKEHTAGEEALARRLADPVKKDELEPRVMHDVDCVAGVLTLRKGHRSSSIEEVRAVFATSSSLVIRNTRLWWEQDEHETGIAPIVHIRALASLAWLKKPLLCADFKVRELVALCAAALRPSMETWRRFLKHLESLRASQRLTSDEVAAIVVSAMSDRLLREAEMEEGDPSDIDATTLDEIVDRVKASYGAQADQRIREVAEEYARKLSEADARAQAARSQVEATERAMAEHMRQRELFVCGRATVWARCVTQGVQWLLAAIVVIGAVALITGHPFHGGLLGAAIGAAVVVFVALELVGILRHVREWRIALEVRLRSRLRAWLNADPHDGQSRPVEHTYPQSAERHAVGPTDEPDAPSGAARASSRGSEQTRDAGT